MYGVNPYLVNPYSQASFPAHILCERRITICAMDVSLVITLGSVLIAALSCSVAVIGSLRNSRHDAQDLSAQLNEIMTKLEFLSEDIRDMKAELRNTDTRVDAVRDLAIGADHKADDALRRLKVLEEIK